MSGLIKRIICAVTDKNSGKYGWAVIDNKAAVELIDSCVEKSDLPAVIIVSGPVVSDVLTAAIYGNLDLGLVQDEFPYAAYIDGEQSPVIYVGLS